MGPLSRSRGGRQATWIVGVIGLDSKVVEPLSPCDEAAQRNAERRQVELIAKFRRVMRS